jgi:hypothetical protein
MKLMTTALVLLATTSVAMAQMPPLNTVITDGTHPFAEGVMTGWDLQVDGVTLCSNPYVIGRYITCGTALTISGKTYQADTTTRVWPETNGQLGAMAIVDSAGGIACTDPQSWSRGPTVFCNR